ncbi:subtilisin-like protease SBT6.1 isoform X2 [Ananas comosus]|uniref:Subtilisin-like protease SBT6.1 isoform X2 n=1 Tax=Ananas comosus TaxID=4615 RepID=A0A6P5FV20_ANACO|nr:subtilisin-like protease SBT6.1 isoform X2 [Ananas comosus]
MMQRSQVTSLFGAERLWAKGFTGSQVKMAIFDTGIRADHPHFRNIKERTNWTNEDTLNDNLGHGTFVAGVIAGEAAECLGFAPDTEIYAFRVFTDAQVSYTSWFLDAFNYAIATNIDVLNLSIGGPDYLDLPFVEKVWEITANNIIMVSAIGNDGPLYGTLNNPADQSDVIGVGGIDYNNHIASFSSRGMTTWEIPHGYGRIKPDVVAYGRDIMGSKISTGCKSLSGTSVASPVVAGAVCLLVSVIPKDKRKALLNPASMKQALVEGATKLSGPNMYEQGAGRLDLWESYEILKNYQPRASIFPSILDYTDCPYSWPFCRQPLYAGAMPVIFNATILNGMGVIGYVKDPPAWHPFDEVGNLLSIHFTYSDVIWPWTGHLALHMQIKDEGSQFSGVIEGNVTLTLSSPAPAGERNLNPRISTCVFYLKLKVIPTPPRSRRVLWDQYHNIKYPPGYIPRDSLDVRNDILDWHGDHLHTNFHIMFNMLTDAGYYIETLGSPFTCFEASRYGTLLMVDLEEEYFAEEIGKLRDDVVNKGLGLAIFAEWYNVDSMVKMRFFDDNTRSWWTPITGGANIPALNDLLAPLGIAFGDKILNGDFSINGEHSHYASGTDIVRFPGGGYVHSFKFQDNSESAAVQNRAQNTGTTKLSAILGLAEAGRGRVAVYGDSNCLDSSHMVTNCYWLLRKILDFTNRNIRDPVLFSESAKIKYPIYEEESRSPLRRTDVNFSQYSKVTGRDLVCHHDSRFEVWGTKGYGIQLMGRSRKLPGYPSMELVSDSNITTESSGSRLDVLTMQKSGRNSIGATAHRFGNSTDFLTFVNRDEVDVRMLMASQWIIPLFLAVTCLLLFLSWGVRQKRRKRRRGSVSSRLTNLVSQ